MKTLLSIPLALAMLTASAEPVKMVFNDTDVATVFRAISAQTGSTIVYSNKEKLPVTLNLSAGSVEQAVKIVAATAGLSFRKAGEAYVVAPEDVMRRALMPFNYRVTFSLEPGAATRLADPLQKAFPYATVETVGDKIVFNGLLEDIREARTYLETMREREQRAKPATDVVVLVSASPADVAKIVSAMYPTVKATPTGDEKTVGGVLGLSGPQSDLVPARKLASSMDVQSSPEGPNPVVTQVYHLRYTSAPQAEEFVKKVLPEVEVFVAPESYTPFRARFSPLAAALSGGSGGFSNLNSQNQQGNQQGGGQGGQEAAAMTVQKGDRARMVVLKGRRSAVDQALSILQGVDTKPHQVVVEVNVVEMPTNDSSKLGVDWSWSPFDFHELDPGTDVDGNPAGGPWDKYTTKPTGFGIWSRAPFNLRGILDAMVTKGSAKILAKPSVSVIDNEQASVFIGDTIRVPVTTQGALGAQNVQIEEFPVGIILLISPRLNANGNITLRVNPVVSSVTDMVNGLPQTSAREAETSMIVKDGETVVLGGLISDEERKAVSGIPILSNLPLVGMLFRHETKSHRKTEVMVSLTTRILKDDEAEAERK